MTRSCVKQQNSLFWFCKEHKKKEEEARRQEGMKDSPLISCLVDAKRKHLQILTKGNSVCNVIESKICLSLQSERKSRSEIYLVSSNQNLIM
jgi:hypothetical protein